MPPTSYSSLSTSSLLDLKAELANKEAEFKATRHLGTTTTGAVKRPGKKPSAWSASNKGLAARQARDAVQYERDVAAAGKDPAQLRAILEKKALIYDKISKGKSAGLNDGQIDNLLVDFDRKDQEADSDPDDDDDDASSEPEQSDPLVEWTDDLGRTRMIRRSEVPRGVALPAEGVPDDSNVIYGDQYSFPVYTPDPAVLAARAAAYEASAPLVQHYDASTENRSRGAGFYTFSKDEDTRQQQMAEMERARVGTDKSRADAASGGGVVGAREREKEERRRKVDEKRRQLELKRKGAVSVGAEDEGTEGVKRRA